MSEVTNSGVSYDLKKILNSLFEGAHLSKSEAFEVLTAIGEGRVDAFQTTALLTCFQMRPISGVELSGFREAMVNLAKPIDFSDFETIDLCGTGGDGKDTFNISTISSLVVAGAGYKVAKHGNYGVSSGCGSSNVLEYLGYEFSNNQDKLRTDLEKGNFCYMHAPLFHPAMRHVGPIRKGLKVKTFFNMLGPLLNPSRPKRQITGVFSSELLPLYQEVFEDMDIEYAVLHSDDGYDEISLTSTFQAYTRQGNKTIKPEELGFAQLRQEELNGGDTIANAAKIFIDILEGKGTDAQVSAVTANAGYAIQRFNLEQDIKESIAEAKESIVSGQALRRLKNIISD